MMTRFSGRSRRAVWAMLAVLCGVVWAPARAAEADASYPSRPIRLVLPSAAGAGGDIVARIVADPLSRVLGQQVLIDNRPGGAGNVAAEFVLKSPADGYTLMQGNPSTHSVNPHIYAKAKYDPVRDFKPVARLVSIPNVLIVNPSLGVNSMADLVALARRDREKLTYGSGGMATTHHLAGELLSATLGVPLTHVPYKGAAQAVTAVITGEVAFMFPNAPNALAFVKQGRLKAIAVTTPQRVSWLPDLPTASESGLPGFEVIAWVGIFAPAATPDVVVAKLASELERVHQLPEVREKLTGQGIDVQVQTGEAFRSFLRSEYEKWGRIVRAAGVKAE